MKQYYFQYVYYLKKLLSRINLVLLFFLLPINSYSSEVFFVEKGSAVIGDVKKIRVSGFETVADIANAIIYLLQNKDSLKFYQIINIADDEPCSQIDVIQYCYDLLGLTMPKPILFEDAKDELSPIAQSFWMENRRVSNKLLCETLGYKLIYKNYKIGLKNCYLNS